MTLFSVLLRVFRLRVIYGSTASISSPPLKKRSTTFVILLKVFLLLFNLQVFPLLEITVFTFFALTVSPLSVAAGHRRARAPAAPAVLRCMVHFQKSKECACSLLLSPKFEAVLSCRAFSEGSFAPWDSPAFTQNTCHRFIHSQRARKGEREKLRERERELLTNHLWTAILQQTLIFTFSPSFHQTSKLLFVLINISNLHILPFLSDLEREEWQANVLQLRDST